MLRWLFRSEVELSPGPLRLPLLWAWRLAAPVRRWRLRRKISASGRVPVVQDDHG